MKKPNKAANRMIPGRTRGAEVRGGRLAVLMAVVVIGVLSRK
jgi:hypothetical protein